MTVPAGDTAVRSSSASANTTDVVLAARTDFSDRYCLQQTQQTPMNADFKSAVIWPSALRSSESTQAVDPTPQRLPPSVVGAHLAIAPSMTRIRRSGRRRKSRGTCARTGPESGWRISHNDHGRMVRPASGLGDVPLPGRCRTSRREGSLSAPTTHHRHPALSVRRESAALSHLISAT